MRLVRGSLVLLASIALLASEVDATAAESLSLDVRIAGLALQNPASSAPPLQSTAPAKVGALLEYQFANAGRTEILTLVQHPGAARFEISEARVASSVPGEAVAVFPGAPAQFVSGLGVKLGMSRIEVARVLGSPERESEGELEYRYTLEENREKLQSFNMPEYRGLYRFKAGRLVAFEFGFPYP